MIDPGDSGPVWRLDLRVDVLEAGHGLTVVTVLVDGREIFARIGGQHYRGWHPAMILEPDDAPLLPTEPPCRVGIYPSDSIYTAEACVTAMVAATGDRVAWTDIRNFVGWHKPVTAPDPDIAISAGEALQIPDLVFDAAQYRAEVARATADRSWETNELKTARLLRQRLRRAQDRLAALGWRPDFVEPRRAGGFWVAFCDAEDAQLIVAMAPEPGTAEQQAATMADLLLSTPPQEWPVIHCSACGLNDPRDLGGSAVEDTGTARRRPLHAHSPATGVARQAR